MPTLVGINGTPLDDESQQPLANACGPRYDAPWMPPDAPRSAIARPDALGVGGPRSEATRRTILDAARHAFAARGYEQTTIRAVAGEAGIDASMVMRYFGSKPGLF